MAGQKGGVAARAEALLRPVIEGLGLRLWDVRFEKEGPDAFLRVYIDRDTPMDTDTCEAASRAIDPVLDDADLIEGSYYLEVGSPGLGRKLTRPAHFEALLGREVYIKLYKPDDAGRKELRGAMQRADGEGFCVKTDDGEEVCFDYKQTALVKSTDDEHLFD